MKNLLKDELEKRALHDPHVQAAFQAYRNDDEMTYEELAIRLAITLSDYSQRLLGALQYEKERNPTTFFQGVKE